MRSRSPAAVIAVVLTMVLVLFLLLVAGAMWAVFRHVSSPAKVAGQVSVVATLTPTSDGVRVQETVTLVSGTLPARVSVPASWGDADWRLEDPAAAAHLSPGDGYTVQNLVVDGVPRTAGRSFAVSGGTVQVSFTFSRRQLDRLRVAQVDSPFPQVAAQSVDVTVQGDPASCLVVSDQRPGVTGKVWAAACPDARSVTVRRHEVTAGRSDPYLVPALVRVVFAG